MMEKWKTLLVVRLGFWRCEILTHIPVFLSFYLYLCLTFFNPLIYPSLARILFADSLCAICMKRRVNMQHKTKRTQNLSQILWIFYIYLYEFREFDIWTCTKYHVRVMKLTENYKTSDPLKIRKIKLK